MDRDERETNSLRSISEEIRDIISEARSAIITDPSKAILYAKTALITAQDKSMSDEELDCLILLAEGQMQLNQFNDAFDFIAKAESFSDANLQNRKAEVLILYGDIFQAEKNYDRAIEKYLNALDIIKNMDPDPQYHGSLLNKIASIYFLQGDFKTAKDYFALLLDWSEKNTERLWTASTLINIGQIYNKTSSFDLALDYFLKSLTIYTELENIDGIIYNQINLGLLYWRRYQYDRALEYLKAAHENVSKTVDKNLMYEVLNNLGMIYRNLKQYEEAKKCYDEAMRIRQIAAESPKIANENVKVVTIGERLNSLLNLITVYIRLELKEATTEAVNEAISLLEQIDNKELRKDTFKVLSDYYHHINDYKEAYEYYKQYIKISEEIHAEQETLKFANVELNHELKKVQEKTENRLKIAKTTAALAMAITASHEVNQPLMIIVGNLELLQESLKDKEISEKQKTYMQNIKLGVERVNNILKKFQNSKDIDFGTYPGDKPFVVFKEEKENNPD
ncbi:MAG: tetratricopeptide repeat protein [Candidatus Cloacimonetes bacterium]|nr:tetratricopeptide repeat protein [Candidatus Cloacimonadota bacterium]